jgi:DNA-binding transcriptional LysR family regulator
MRRLRRPAGGDAAPATDRSRRVRDTANISPFNPDPASPAMSTTLEGGAMAAAETPDASRSGLVSNNRIGDNFKDQSDYSVFPVPAGSVAMAADRDTTSQVNLKFLSTFRIVAESLSFREAADRTHRSQSAVTAQIKQLESQVGAPLFRRTTRDVQLTAEGEQLLASTQRALHELGVGFRKLHEAADLKRGRIALACSSTAAATFLPPILLRFNTEYPQVRISLREVLSSEFLDCLQRGQADFCVGPAIENSNLKSEILFDDPILAFVPHRFGSRERDSISLRELAGMPLALFGPLTAIRSQVEKAFRERGLRLEIQFECRQAQTLVALAEGSLGAAILSRSALQNHKPRAAKILRITDPLMRRPIAIVGLRGQVLTPRAGRLVQLLRDQLARPTAAAAGGRSAKRRAAKDAEPRKFKSES